MSSHVHHLKVKVMHFKSERAQRSNVILARTRPVTAGPWRSLLPGWTPSVTIQNVIAETNGAIVMRGFE